MNKALGLMRNPKNEEVQVVEVVLEPNLDGKIKTKVNVLSSHTSRSNAILSLQQEMAKYQANMMLNP